MATLTKQFAQTSPSRKVATGTLKELMLIHSIRCTVRNHYAEYYAKRQAPKKGFGLPDKVAIYLCSELTEASTASLAAEFGCKSSNSIVVAVVEVRGMLSDPHFKALIAKLSAPYLVN